MVVGFESVGKTTLLDCLFPLKGILSLKEAGLLKIITSYKEYFFVIQGKYFRKYPVEAAHLESLQGVKPLEVIELEERGWSVQEMENEKKHLFGFQLSYTPGVGSSPGGNNAGKVFEFYTPNKAERDGWMERLKRLVKNAATHGIEIQNLKVDDPVIKEVIKSGAGASGNLGEGTKLDLAIWDFAGQHDYYNNHHYFISARTVFLVLWKMKDGKKGLEGLEFWFKSLAAHLPLGDGAAAAGAGTVNATKNVLSIIVIGTFLDHPSVNPDQSEDRREEITELAQECGIKHPLIIQEVSCQTLENIDDVRQVILASALSHSYMAETVPSTYITLQNVIKELRENKEQFPIMDISRFKEVWPGGQLEMDWNSLKRALGLLSLWGDCVYYEKPVELSNTVILDPKFLTKDVLAQLFNPMMVSYYKDGVVRHADLPQIWQSLNRWKMSQAGPSSSASGGDGKRNLARGIDGGNSKKQQGGGGGVNLSKSSSSNEISAGDFLSWAPKVMALMEKFEVSFVLEEDHGKPFDQQRSIIPALLPKRVKPNERNQLPVNLPAKDRLKMETFKSLWPVDPPFDRKHQFSRVIQFNTIPSELVGRLLVRMHPHIQDNMVWQNDVLLCNHDNTQAWLQMDMELNRFHVALRGSDHHACCKLLDVIIKHVKTVSGNYGGVKFREFGKSPHHPTALVDIDQAAADVTLPLHLRSLVCPETKLPIDSEMFLRQTGIVDYEVDAKQNVDKPWWKIDFAAQKGLKRENLESLLILENGKILIPTLYKKLELLFSHFGGNPLMISKAYAIDNLNSTNLFLAGMSSITQKHKDSPSLFKKRDWERNTTNQEGSQMKKEMERRKAFLLHLNKQIAKFRREFNSGTELFVLPMIQGTKEEFAWKIVKNGFGTVATTDEGYYGKGIYFTSDFNYAKKYAGTGNTTPAKLSSESLPSNPGQVFVISMTIPGNPYPVIEPPFQTPGSNQTVNQGQNVKSAVEATSSQDGDLSKIESNSSLTSSNSTTNMSSLSNVNVNGFLGKPCQPGYQSHYTIVNKKSTGSAFPIETDQIDPTQHADELVVFQEAQTLPLFLIYCQSEPVCKEFTIQEQPIIEPPQPSPQTLSVEKLIPIPQNPDPKPSPQTPSVEKPTSSDPHEWSPEQVAEWSKTLGLKNDYSSLFLDNYITGTVLLSLTESDWQALGVTLFGDKRTFQLKVAELMKA